MKNINPRVSNISNGKTMLLSKCAMCGTKNQDLLKTRSKRNIISLKTSLRKVPLRGDILF